MISTKDSLLDKAGREWHVMGESLREMYSLSDPIEKLAVMGLLRQASLLLAGTDGEVISLR